MTLPITSLLTYQCAVADRVMEGIAATQAEVEILPDYLEWQADGYTPALRGNSTYPAEGASFDDFDLDEAETPAWAVDAYWALAAAQRDEIRDAALEAALDRAEKEGEP